jgi:hypothetical protein
MEEHASSGFRIRWTIGLLIGALIGGVAQAWTSAKGPWSDDIHQMAIDRVLGNLLSDASRQILKDDQTLIDKDQSAEQSAEHSMTGMTGDGQVEATQRAAYIAKTEQLLALNFKAAIDSRKAGNEPQAMHALARTLHALEDATSPAHSGFQVWSSNFGLWEMAMHVFKERSYPSDDGTHNYKTKLEAAVLYAYNLYLEKTPPPAHFFSGDGCLLTIDPDCHRS